MLFAVLEPIAAGAWGDLSCLDLACHEGFFAIHLALRGCRPVLGIDARPEHVSNADLIRDLYGLSALRFEVGDVTAIRPEQLGCFDVVVLFGLLYHIENPIGVLRLAHRLTTRVCVIETQVANNLSERIDWGSHRSMRRMVGCFGLVDERTEVENNAEASVTGISLVPSREGLLWALGAVGFVRAEVLAPPPDSYEQIATGKRIVIAAYPK